MNLNSEKIGYKNSSAHELLSKNKPHCVRLMAKNDVKRFDWFKNSELKFINLEKSYGIFRFSRNNTIYVHFRLNRNLNFE